MPALEETAAIVTNGSTFNDWETVEVDIDVENWTRTFQFSVSEAVYGLGAGAATLATQQLKPGDTCEVMLAGQLVATGRIVGRQAAYDANTHAVLIVGKSLTGDLVKSSAPVKGSQMRGYAFSPIMQNLIQPFGVKLIEGAMPNGFDKAFKDVSVWPGETIFECGDRLARQRGIFVHDDEKGNLVAGFVQGSGGPTALIEGVNIKSANCSISDETVFNQLSVLSQHRGDDQTDGETARKPSASVSGDSSYHSPRTIVAEEPGDKDDAQMRAQHESNFLKGATIVAVVVVNGWLKNDGTLWKEAENVRVTSPMLLLDQDLVIKSIRFTQNDASGTETTLTLVRPESLGFNQSGPLPIPGA